MDQATLVITTVKQGKVKAGTTVSDALLAMGVDAKLVEKYAVTINGKTASLTDKISVNDVVVATGNISGG